MYLHDERNHASLWALGREGQTRLAHRVGCLLLRPHLSWQLITWVPSAPGEASNLLLPRPEGIVTRGVRLWRHFLYLGNAIWFRTEFGL